MKNQSGRINIFIIFCFVIGTFIAIICNPSFVSSQGFHSPGFGPGAGSGMGPGMGRVLVADSD